MDADGTNLRQLTHTPTPKCQPSWSWDGRRIAFVSFRDGNAELYTLDVDSGEEVRLTEMMRVDAVPHFLPRAVP